MKKIAGALLSLILFVSTAQGADYAACIVGGVSKICPGDVQLKPGQTVQAAYIPGLDAAKIVSGDISLARIATSLAAGGGAVKGTVVTATTRVDAPSIGTDSSNQHVLPSGTNEILAPARGTAGQVLTSTGSGSPPAMAAPITATAGSAVLGSTFLITGASGVYQDTGLTLSLPSTGTYLLSGRILGNVNVLTSGPGFISCKFRDTTAGADVANSQTIIAFVQAINTTVIATAPMFSTLTVTGTPSVNLYCARNLASAYNTSELNSTSAGYTQISYIKIGP